MIINDLTVEVTRRCNMFCEHCMRGDAENKDIDYKHIDSLLSQCEEIRSVTFTGGEPSMNVPAIEYFLQRMKDLGVTLGSFYIATNGLDIKENFIIACIKLYSYSDDKEMCSVHVSNDIFHEREGEYNIELLQGLRFFRKKFEEDGHDYDRYRYLINEGRAAENFSSNRVQNKHEIKTVEDFDSDVISLNCNGEIINGCDWSYESQKENVLCTVDKLTEYYESLLVE